MIPYPLGLLQYLEHFHAVDSLQAEDTKKRGCPRCPAGTLDAAHYFRKLGGLGNTIPRRLLKRFSFCCRRCRKRVTPGSTRFAGRWVYAKIWVLLLPLLLHSQRVRASRQTRRVMRWWRHEAPLSKPYATLVSQLPRIGEDFVGGVIKGFSLTEDLFLRETTQEGVRRLTCALCWLPGVLFRFEPSLRGDL